jgi:hypothetical protein
MENLFELITNINCNLLKTNIDTSATDAQNLEFTTNTNNALTKAWTTDNKNQFNTATNQFDNPVMQYLYSQNIITSAGQLNTAASAGSLAGAYNTFITTYIVPGNIDEFSAALGNFVLTVGASSGCWDPNTDPTQNHNEANLNQVNQFMTEVNAAGKQEEQTGQTDVKMIGSVMQQDQGYPQQLMQMFSSIMDVFSTINTTLSSQA